MWPLLSVCLYPSISTVSFSGGNCLGSVGHWCFYCNVDAIFQKYAKWKPPSVRLSWVPNFIFSRIFMLKTSLDPPSYSIPTTPWCYSSKFYLNAVSSCFFKLERCVPAQTGRYLDWERNFPFPRRTYSILGSDSSQQRVVAFEIMVWKLARKTC